LNKPPVLLTLLPQLLALAAALLVGGWAALRLRSWLDRWRRLRRAHRAETGENRALVWLRKNGFTILGEQQTLLCEMRIDGETVEYEVCVDFLVQRYGERAVVEVKTGSAAHPAKPETRRQIFEYAAAYGVDRAYMFDGDRGTLHEMEFLVGPRGRPARAGGFTAWGFGVACGLVLAAVVAWLVWRPVP
jgi:Holliday junction resolvase-like predicted endonuclease